MKHEKLASALNEVRDEYLAEASQIPKRRPWRAVSAIAAMLAVVITATFFLWPGSPGGNMAADKAESAESPEQFCPTLAAKSLIAKPEYPAMADYPTDPNDWDSWQRWNDSWCQQYGQPAGYGDNLETFYTSSIPIFLDSGTENKVYSPINVYMALAMLAQTSGGESRQEILDVLNANDMEALRTQAGHLWNAHYCDDGLTTLLLANSLWLDNSLSYQADCADTLARDFYASVYHGDLGTEEMNQALRDWLNENTGGLLREQAGDLELDDSILLALASTIYYRAQWAEKFQEENNRQDIFHAPSEDRTVTYLCKTLSYGPYYYGEDYSAISLRLEDDSRMWLILPDAGFTPQDILKSGHALDDILTADGTRRSASVKVHLQLPKFDIVSETDLIPGLRQLGLSQIFDPARADCSGITQEPLFLSQAEHAARVKIDEDGLEAAAYTVLARAGGAIPPEEEVDFILDRPFLFLIESRDGVPLFTGVVNEP